MSRGKDNIKAHDKVLSYFNQKVLIFLIFLQENILWVLIRTASLKHFLRVLQYVFCGEIQKILYLDLCNNMKSSQKHAYIILTPLNATFIYYFSYFYSKT